MQDLYTETEGVVYSMIDTRESRPVMWQFFFGQMKYVRTAEEERAWIHSLWTLSMDAIFFKYCTFSEHF
jgi:hypothetical protein